MLPDRQDFKALYADSASAISQLRNDTSDSLLTIQHMLVDQFDLTFESLAPDAKLESLGVDSLSMIEFMFLLEDELKIKLPDERIELKTVGDVANIVDKIITSQRIYA